MKRRFGAHRWWRRRTLHRYVILLTVLICVVSVCGLALVRCRSIVNDFAESNALWLAEKIANETALRILQERAESCSSAVSVVYDGASKVSALHMNTATINDVRSALTVSVMDAIEEHMSLPTSIPLGTLSGFHWLSGCGPLISFPMSFTATVLSDISSDLQGVTINQSFFRLHVNLFISLYVVTPAGRSTVSTTVGVPMVEVVLLGDVPDNLTEVYGDDQSLSGQIFDYGASQ